MAIEIEKKYRLDKRSRKELTARLAELGATFSTERFEENFLYRHGAEDVTSRLRLRVIGDTTYLTYKERVKSDSEFKTKIEHETIVSDAEEMRQIIAKLGYDLAVIYEKYRKTWHLGKCEIVLDELPFGIYMEIEGEPENILKVEKKLGANVLESEPRGYARLTIKLCKETNGIYEARFGKVAAARSER